MTGTRNGRLGQSGGFVIHVIHYDGIFIFRPPPHLIFNLHATLVYTKMIWAQPPRPGGYAWGKWVSCTYTHTYFFTATLVLAHIAAMPPMPRVTTRWLEPSSCLMSVCGPVAVCVCVSSERPE